MPAPDRTITVALSFASSAYHFAERLSRDLTSHGFAVVTDHHGLSRAAQTWGLHKFTLIDGVVDKDIDFCMVILTPDYLTEKWSSYAHCRLVEATLQRKGFILPIRLGDHAVRLRGITDYLGDIRVHDTEHDKVVSLLLEKVGRISDIVETPFTKHGDIETVLRLYNPKLDLRELDCHEDRVAQIGYELYEATDTLTQRSISFLHLYRGVNISATAGHVLGRHSEVLSGNPMIILMPKEPHQTQRQRRLDNVQSVFKATKAFYIDQFVWEQCTDPSFREPQAGYDLPAFIDPNVDGPREETALSAILGWFRKESAPVLIIQGSGGIGKTTVAKAFANKVIADGGRILFVDDEQIVDYLMRHKETLAAPFDVYHAYLASAAARSSDLRPSLSNELFRINFDSGNITIIIDGLDEVISRFGSHFSIEGFLDSIYEHTAQTQQGKVLITCRNQFLAATEIDVNVNTIDLLPFNTQLATRYFERRFPSLPKAIDRGLRMARRLMRIDGAEAFIPFVLDVVAYVLQEQLQGDDPFDDPGFDSEILDRSHENDYIIGKVCQREAKKYRQGLSTDEQVRFFLDLAVRDGSIIRTAELHDKLGRALDSTIDHIQTQTLLSHPLLRVDRTSVSFKYDLLAPSFQALAVSRLIQGTERLNANLFRILAERTEFATGFIEDCAARLAEPRDDLALKMIPLIEQVYASEERDVQRRRAVSGLFMIALFRLRTLTGLSRETATELMKDLFINNGRLRRVALCGLKERIAFTFAGMTLEDCFFSRYDNFWECTFDKATRFQNCSLFLLDLPEGINTSARRDNFDLNSCQIDDTIQRVLDRTASVMARAETTATKDLDHFLKLFYKHGHMVGAREKMLRAKYKGTISYNVLVEHLKFYGFLRDRITQKSKGLGPELEIASEYRSDAIRFCIEGTMSVTIKSIIKSLPKQ